MGLVGLATVEFLVSGDRYVFLEVNPRLQVEHTVTEAVTGLDLVDLQLAVSDGAGPSELGLPSCIQATTDVPPVGSPISTRGTAIQSRVNAEVLDASGHLSAAGGTITEFVPPTGAGIRVDTFLRIGTTITGRYDTLLTKVIVHTQGGIEAATKKAAAALDDLVIEGVSTNSGLLAAVLRDGDFAAGSVTTGWFAEHLPRFADALASAEVVAEMDVLDLAPDEDALRTPMLGTVVSLPQVGAVVPPGGEVAVIEAMKMQHALVDARRGRGCRRSR